MKKCIYLVEGDCEEKLIKALKEKPALVLPGRVKILNVVQNEIPRSIMMSLEPGSLVVFVFDTDKEVTEHLKKNIEVLRRLKFNFTVLTFAQVLNFEDEIVRATDVRKAQELTKSTSVRDFKTDFCKMKAASCRSALERHHLDVGKLWVTTPPEVFSFITQESEKVKI